MDELSSELLSLLREIKVSLLEQQQLLLSQRLLLLALSESVADVPALRARYQALLFEHARENGVTLPALPVGR